MTKDACTFIFSPLKDFSFGYDTASFKCIELKLQLAHYISDMYKAGVRDFYSVCEEGFDLWAAEIVTFIMKKDPGTRLHCVIPYEEQAAKWNSQTRELYYSVLEQATEVTFVSKQYREGCLAAARYIALDHCKRVFVSVVGKKEENELVRYSIMTEKSIFSLDCA